VHRDREQKTNAFHERTGQNLFGADSSTDNGDPRSSGLPEDPQGSPIALVEMPKLRGGGREMRPVSVPDKSRKQWKKRMVSFDPTFPADDSNNESHRCPRKAHMTDSTNTPSKGSSPYHLPPPRRTPYPQEYSRLSSHQKDDGAYSPQSRSSDIAAEPTNEPCCDLGSHFQQREIVQESRLLPNKGECGITQQGLSHSPTLSVGCLSAYVSNSPGAKSGPHTVNIVETMLNKSMTEKGGKQNVVKGIKGKGKNRRGAARTWSKAASKEHDIDTRRESLQKEPRGMVCEE
jgi:hypothetical protein